MTGQKDKQWGDEIEAAELIWCAAHLHLILAPPSLKDPPQSKDLPAPNLESPDRETLEDSPKNIPPPSEKIEPRTSIATYSKNAESSPPSPKKESPSSDRASPVRVPDPFPLPKPASLSKALLPLDRRVPGILATEFDIEATVDRTAEANGLPIVAFRPPLERWFEVHLLIDRSPSMEFWGDLAEGVATLFRWQGFFRDVRVWQFETGKDEPRLISGAEGIERDIGSLIAPGRNRLFIVFTDTLGKAWHSGAAFAVLAVLGERHPVTIAHVFPQTLWRRTALERAILRPLVAPDPGCPNSKLKVGARLHTTAALYRFPIFNLSPNNFATLANFLAGSGGNSIQGVLLLQETPVVTEVESSKQERHAPEPTEETPKHLLREFLTDASPEARKLAQVLAAVPLIPPVMRLAQQQFLPDSEHWHLAEVFFSGLIQRSPLGPKEASVPEAWYEFRSGIRELLLTNSPVLRTAEIWREIGNFIEKNYGSPRDFRALLPNPAGSLQDTATDRDLYFAEVDAAVLMTWGGEYATRAQELQKQVAARKEQTIVQTEGSPPPFEFEVARIEIDRSARITPDNALETIDREVFSQTGKSLNDLERLVVEGTLADRTYEEIAASGIMYSLTHIKSTAIKLWKVLSGVFGEKVTKSNLKKVFQRWVAGSHLIIKRDRHQANCFIEDLGNGVQLEMVAVPGGSFLMGSPEDELDRFRSESPQHRVTIPPFFLAKYPVTQAQWQAVAFLPQVNRELNPDPSYFKEPYQDYDRWTRPVETISWEDAVEFCDRLSRHTGQFYRLPSEAEWEYAARAGTTTAFHFGETIVSELANYNANYTYGEGVQGEYREQTTPLAYFGVANAFGLYDMHGNVREWCEDNWHSNYDGAPTDGSAWAIDDKNTTKVLRGGSWYGIPSYCRCASRFNFNPVVRDYDIGLRVARAAPRTQ